jgi:hypothetical protein
VDDRCDGAPSESAHFLASYKELGIYATLLTERVLYARARDGFFGP